MKEPEWSGKTMQVEVKDVTGSVEKNTFAEYLDGVPVMFVKQIQQLAEKWHFNWTKGGGLPLLSADLTTMDDKGAVISIHIEYKNKKIGTKELIKPESKEVVTSEQLAPGIREQLSESGSADNTDNSGN